MKIRAKVKRYETQEIEVEFPVYVRECEVFNEGGGFEKWTRYEADGRYVEIIRRDTPWIKDSWEFRRSTIRNPAENESALGYHLLECSNGSTQAEFDAAMRLLRQTVMEDPK